MTTYTDDPYCTYPNSLRAMFSRINPYSFSCVYKHMFEQHAVDTLRNCEVDSLGVADTYMYHLDAYHMVDSLNTNHDNDSGWNYPWVTDKEMYGEKSFLEQLYFDMHMTQDDFPVLEGSGGTGPWTICNHCQQPYFHSYTQDRCTVYDEVSGISSRPCSAASTPVSSICLSSPTPRHQTLGPNKFTKCSSAPKTQANTYKESTERAQDRIHSPASVAGAEFKPSNVLLKSIPAKFAKGPFATNKKTLCNSVSNKDISAKKKNKPPHVQSQDVNNTTAINIVTQKHLLDAPKLTQNTSSTACSNIIPGNKNKDNVTPKRERSTLDIHMSLNKKKLGSKNHKNNNDLDDKIVEKKESTKTWKVSGTNDSFPFPGVIKLNKRVPYQPPPVQYKDEAASLLYRYYPDWRFYMQQYREVYTDKNLRRPLLSMFPDKIQMLRSREIISKVTVECTDVRDGACIRPCPPTRLTEFTFDISRRLRVDLLSESHSLNQKKSSKNSIDSYNSSPDRASMDETSCHDEITGYISPKCQNFQYPADSWVSPTGSTNAITSIPRSNSQRNSQLEVMQLGSSSLQHGPLGGLPHNTLVSRSRPSIPSNARGVVCPSAVETPVHVIARRNIVSSNIIGRPLGSTSPTPDSLDTSTNSSLSLSMDS